MRHHVSQICSFILSVVLVSCAPPKGEREAVSVCYPYDLRVDAGDRQMTVIWKVNCNRMMSGYYVYINEEPLVKKYPGPELPPSVKPFNRVPFPGDTDPSDNLQHFTAEGLDNGVRYYVSVRVVNPDRTLSKPSNEVVAVCGPRGEIELSVRFKSDRDGFSFEKNTYVRADAINNDLYFSSKDGRDYLASPYRLGGFLRASQLSLLPFEGDFDEVRSMVDDINSHPGSDRVAVKPGDWLLLRTSDNRHALLKVLEITGTGERRRIKLFYAFNPLPNELLF